MDNIDVRVPYCPIQHKVFSEIYRGKEIETHLLKGRRPSESDGAIARLDGCHLSNTRDDLECLLEERVGQWNRRRNEDSVGCTPALCVV